MNVNIKKFLFDIQTSIKAINDYLGTDRNFYEFDKNRMLKKAVEREFEIIGEAVKRITQIDKDIAITTPRKIIDLRNYLAHGYDTVDYAALWGIISNHLPLLEQEVNTILKNEQVFG